jgi:phosphoglycerol transferase MdoB-like AlkP superfamily enzyme
MTAGPWLIAAWGCDRLGRRVSMPPVASALLSRFARHAGTSPRDLAALIVIAVLHAIALAVMLTTEGDLVSKSTFLATWFLLNFFWLAVLRRPASAALVSLAMVVTLILLSQFKYDKLFMTVNFVDVMILDTDTIAFFLTIYPDLLRRIVLAALVAVPALGLLWWLDPYRVRLRVASAGGTLCFAGAVAISMAAPMEPHEAFSGDGYISKFVNSGVDAVSAYLTQGYLDADTNLTGKFRFAAAGACQPAAKPPHIILILDESSFDIRKAPGIKVPSGYGGHFNSFDGKERSFIVEAAGGPTWFAEYSVLTGLSARSFGRFAYFVTRIAAGRVERGLPHMLKRCGYHTFTLYPARSAFMSARSFQTTTGVENFRDSKDLGAKGVEPDSFFYDQAAQVIAREGKKAPLFIFSYLAANHFPWDYTFHPELTPDWRKLGNPPHIDEYVRRQGLSERDYAAFLARLRHDFPDESFMLVRFGDHQPDFAERIIDPSLNEWQIADRLDNYDPRFFTTYYAIDAVNFKPVDVSSALGTLEAPYLPLVIQEAAGLPLDPTFAEQKNILQRCRGLFYGCAKGAEARRFNRLLIEAGLIKGL